ncbi:MAG: hypothetical protein Q9227_005170 [Pyrenula ochraceoflavens]
MVSSTLKDEIQSLRSGLNASIDKYLASADIQSETDVSQSLKADITAKADKLVKATRDPRQQIFEMGLGPQVILVIRIGIDLDLFEHLQESATLDELAQKTKGSRNLLNVVKEVKEKTFVNGPIGDLLRTSHVRGWFINSFDSLAPIWLQTHKFFAQNGYKDAEDPNDYPSTFVNNGLPFFDWLSEHPDLEEAFAAAMRVKDNMDTEGYLEPGISDFKGGPDTPFLVDIGGGAGHFLEQVHKSYPKLPGYNILQDLSTVISPLSEEFQRSNGFRKMSHSFMDPQPIHGAKYYHLRSIIHDWPDEVCVQILKNLRGACTPGYSKVLIHDTILPEMGVSLGDALIDINMWTCCGKERTENEMRDLFTKAGFRPVRCIKLKRGLNIVEGEVPA